MSLTRIKELFITLKQGHDWLERYKDNNLACAELVDRSEPIFDELEGLGVSKVFSRSLLVFGPLVTDELVGQFADQGKQEDLKLT